MTLFWSAPAAYAQEIKVQCTDEPLNHILITLRDNYNIMLSFDDRQLSRYRLSVDRSFSSVPQAFDYLFRGLPLTYELSDGVYIIYAAKPKEKTKNYIIAGRILDKTNLETLPFSGILINNTGLISDAKGFFSYTTTNDSIFKIKISYLGYYILDTILPPGTNYSFKLIPSVIALEEILVQGLAVNRSIQISSSPGITKLNHKVAYYLPGNGDNSVFNLLRLQPGIMAAGDQSSDLMIWGSYEGQSQIIFDGYTLYGMKNFNDNISAINPFMAKDIKVMKGGYSAEYGERVGGIVDITGIDGNRLSPSVQLCINKMTLNGLLSLPFRKKSSLILAYRQTYYDLYDPIEFTRSGSGRGRQSTGVDFDITPEYRFRDINLKYSGSSKKSNYYISLFGGKDHFTYFFNDVRRERSITLDHNEGNFQLGGAAFYGFTWKQKNTSNVTFSYSKLQTDREHLEETVTTMAPWNDHNLYEKYDAVISEVNGRADNYLNLSEKHMVSAGPGMIYYYTTVHENTYPDTVFGHDKQMIVPYFYAQDKITLFEKLTLKPGIRADYHKRSQNVFIQPRFSVVYRIGNYFSMNSAAGLYNQFTAKNMIMDQSGNYKYIWELCDDKNIPVLKSGHFTLGLSFNKNNFTASAEGYMKSAGGITRYLQSSDRLIRYEGKGKTRGLDFFAKKEFKNQTLWISYTLSKTEEYFTYFGTEAYRPALQDQRHEVKFAGLAKIKSFHFSANYVYGSGLPDPNKLPDTVDYAHPYSRLDASVIYKFSIKKLHLDAGISVLNVLNKQNIKYSNLTYIPTDENTSVSVYAEALPITFTLFLHVYF
ncbi:MAG: TonB-dependent receptor plug domain-containing protein [Bacteroidales bacterium]|nr:TonB-dependent receptor plug domain-containing protein [Bacteroidales bacterium]